VPPAHITDYRPPEGDSSHEQPDISTATQLALEPSAVQLRTVKAIRGPSADRRDSRFANERIN
jgi:hypothetical protein